MQADELTVFEQLIERRRLSIGQHDLVATGIRVVHEDTCAKGAQAPA